MDHKGCPDYISPGFKPNGKRLACAANLGHDHGQAVRETTDLPPALKGWQEPVEEVGSTCRITLRVAFFFDGTGNNMHADEPLLKNSNVARLFRAHHQSREALGLYAFYIPGIGTYFPQIGDPGGSGRELAMGAGGDGRLDWAMQQLEKVINKHPPDKTLQEIKLSVFGFSRGSAEARAFAIRVQDKCEQREGKWCWKARQVPMDFYFMGLFDTVASVGLVPTASLVQSALVAKGWESLNSALDERRQGADGMIDGLRALAFGQPGANPAAGSVGDGHASWGDDLAIPDMVKKCVHFVALHEQRNSFPCDTVRKGRHYPSNCEEFGYPGMHSDVGGGYESGEQGRSVEDALKLSQIPLLHMHALAIQQGVPLIGLDEMAGQYRAYFQLSSKLHEHWNHYMQSAGRGNKPLGQMVLSHTRRWYQWRFHRIHQYLQAILGKKPGDTLPNEDAIRQAEAHFDAQRKQAQAAVGAARDDPGWAAAKQQMSDNQPDTLHDNYMQNRFGLDTHRGANHQVYEQAKQQADMYEARYNRARARLDAMPGSGAAEAIQVYDQNLIRGMHLLHQWVNDKDRNRLRPHYRMLLETYEAEFIDGNGLTDEDLIAFFDEYVHDSLAGFAKDITLPSDPRIFFEGSDDLVKYADNEFDGATQAKTMEVA